MGYLVIKMFTCNLVVYVLFFSGVKCNYTFGSSEITSITSFMKGAGLDVSEFNSSADTSSFKDNLSSKTLTSTEVDTDSQYTTAEFSSTESLSPRDHIQYGSKTDFFGKVVLITGANSGIGKALALHFAKLGATLSLSGSDFFKLYHSYKEIREFATVKPHISCGNLTVSEQAEYVVQYTINRFGKLDVLINNAGVYEFGGIENTTVKQFDRVFDNNVKSMYALTMYAVPYLAKTNGTIINISSLAGLRPFKGILAYCMSKAAVDQFTKCLALELAPKNIRVNSVNPSVVDTGIHIRGGMDPEKYKKYIKESRKKHPLKRITTVEDIVEAVAFLASDKAKFITGVNFPVDGGRSICPS